MGKTDLARPRKKTQKPTEAIGLQSAPAYITMIDIQIHPLHRSPEPPETGKGAVSCRRSYHIILGGASQCHVFLSQPVPPLPLRFRRKGNATFKNGLPRWHGAQSGSCTITLMRSVAPTTRLRWPLPFVSSTRTMLAGPKRRTSPSLASASTSPASRRGIAASAPGASRHTSPVRHYQRPPSRQARTPTATGAAPEGRKPPG